MTSIKTAALVGVLLITVASPALAFKCENLLGKIDNALGKTSNLTSAQIDEIRALRDDGAAKHTSGNHGGSVATLTEAMKKLGLSSGSSSSGSDY